MRKLVILFFYCIVLAGCNRPKNMQIDYKKEKHNNTTGAIDDQIKNIIAGISVNNGSIITTYSIANIDNKIMGIDDEFFTTVPIENCALLDSFKSFTIILPNTIENSEEIMVTLAHNDSEFSATYYLNRCEFKDEFYGYSAYIPLENKYWINYDGKWNVKIYNNNKLQLETTYEAKLFELFYETISDSPLDFTQVRDCKKGIDYTYRFYDKKESIVVLYYSDDGFIFYPVLVIKPTIMEPDKNVVFRWNNESFSGRYYIDHYPINEIPTEEKMIPLFESFSVE